MSDFEDKFGQTIRNPEEYGFVKEINKYYKPADITPSFNRLFSFGLVDNFRFIPYENIDIKNVKKAVNDTIKYNMDNFDNPIIVTISYGIANDKLYEKMKKDNLIYIEDIYIANIKMKYLDMMEDDGVNYILIDENSILNNVKTFIYIKEKYFKDEKGKILILQDFLKDLKIENRELFNLIYLDEIYYKPDKNREKLNNEKQEMEDKIDKAIVICKYDPEKNEARWIGKTKYTLYWINNKGDGLLKKHHFIYLPPQDWGSRVNQQNLKKEIESTIVDIEKMWNKEGYKTESGVFNNIYFIIRENTAMKPEKQKRVEKEEIVILCLSDLVDIIKKLLDITEEGSYEKKTYVIPYSFSDIPYKDRIIQTDTFIYLDFNDNTEEGTVEIVTKYKNNHGYMIKDTNYKGIINPTTNTKDTYKIIKDIKKIYKNDVITNEVITNYEK
jgi:hypothetical protein